MDNAGDDLLAELNFGRIAAGSGDEEETIEDKEEANGTTNAEREGEKVFGETFDVGGDTTEGGVDAGGVNTLAGDGTAFEVTRLTLTGIVADTKAETSF